MQSASTDHIPHSTDKRKWTGAELGRRCRLVCNTEKDQTANKQLGTRPGR